MYLSTLESWKCYRYYRLAVLETGASWQTKLPSVYHHSYQISTLGLQQRIVYHYSKEAQSNIQISENSIWVIKSWARGLVKFDDFHGCCISCFPPFWNFVINDSCLYFCLYRLVKTVRFLLHVERTKSVWIPVSALDTSVWGFLKVCTNLNIAFVIITSSIFRSWKRTKMKLKAFSCTEVDRNRLHLLSDWPISIHVKVW